MKTNLGIETDDIYSSTETESLVFFAVDVIYKKNCSLSRVVFPLLNFFNLRKLPTLFIQKHMAAVGLDQQHSKAVGLGFESLPGQKFLRFIPIVFRYPKLVKH